METQLDFLQINSRVQLLKRTAEELNQLGENFPALTRNIVRIMASIKMLEINITDVFALRIRD